MPENYDPDLSEYNAMCAKEMFGHLAAKEMPRYQSHKEVHALKIAHIEHLRTDTTTDENPIVKIHFVDTGFLPIEINLRGKPTPDVGWYYVVYDGDGYKSFSPAKAFEEGYTLITK